MLRRLFTGEIFSGKTLLERTLIVTWVFVFGGVALLGLFPRLAARIPDPFLIRPSLLLLILVSTVYGVVVLYRHGMKRAKRNSSDGSSHHYDAPR